MKTVTRPRRGAYIGGSPLSNPEALMTLRARAAAVTVALLVAVLAACNDDPIIDDSMVGFYTLVTVNGQAPPVDVATLGGVTTAVLSATADVRSGGTCRYSVELRQTSSAGTSTSTQANDCTWSRNGTAAFFTLDNGDLIAANVAGDTLTLTFFGATFVLER